MPAFAIVDGAVFLGDRVLTSQVEGFGDISGSCAMQEYGRLDGGGFRFFLPSLNSFRSTIQGTCGYAAGEIGQTVTPANRGEQMALTILPQNGAASAAGDIAVIHRGLLESLKMPTGAVGEVARFDLAMQSDLVQTVGYVAAPMASRTTAGLTGTAVALTGPTATQKLYAALHVTAAAGTNLAVKIQSDNGVGFGTPTDRITFSTVSAVGWQFLSVAGDLSAETHWRATATIASSTFTFGVFFGVA